MDLPNAKTWSEWDFNTRVAGNHVPHIAGVSKYGFNPVIVDTTEDIWNAGGVLSYLSSAETMEIASDDSADDGDPAGNGAQTVAIFGVDDNYKNISEIVTMNGTNDVTTTMSFLRINRMRVLTAGSTGSNAGTITATATTAGTVQASMPELTGSTFKSQYTVPDGFYAFIQSINYGTLNNDQVEADLQVREFGGAWVTRDRIDFVESYVNQPFVVPLRVGPKADIRCQAIRISGNGNVRVSARYEMFLIQEDFVNTNSLVVDET